jgi:hypothetical protein
MKSARVIVAVVTMMLALPLPVSAERITPSARWAGQTGKIGDGDSGYLCNQQSLSEFWRSREIGNPKPDIDFSHELAVFYLGSGGLHLMELSVEEGGNLVAVYVQAPTVSRYPNYLIFTVPRDGIKSINGVPVSCAE